MTLHIEFNKSDNDHLKEFMNFIRSHNAKIYTVNKNLSFDTSELLVYSIFIRINVDKKIPIKTQDEIVSEVKKLDYIFHCEKIN